MAPTADKLSDQDILVLTFWDNSIEQTKMLIENKRRKTCFLQGTLFQSCTYSYIATNHWQFQLGHQEHITPIHCEEKTVNNIDYK